MSFGHGQGFANTATLGVLGQQVIIPIDGYSAAGFSLAAGLVGTVSIQFSFDNAASFSSTQENPDVILPLIGNSASGTIACPNGATHCALVVTAFTSGSTVAILRTAIGSAPSSQRVRASGALAAATASVTATTGNFVAMPIDPTRWASATITATATAFNGTVIWDMMINGQWVAAPLATLTSTSGADPSTAASIAYTTTAADSWDLPLPGNCTQVRARCSAFTSGSVTVTVTPGRPYVPGSVTALLKEVTSTGVISTGTIESSGWSSVGVSVVAGGASLVNNFTIDELGTNGVPIGSIAASNSLYSSPVAAAAASWRVAMGASEAPFAQVALVATGSSASLFVSLGKLPRRFSVTTLALAATNILTIEARR